MNGEHDHRASPPTDAPPPPAPRSRWPKVIGVISLIYAIAGLFVTTCMSAWVLVIMETLIGMQGVSLEVPMLLKVQTVGFGVIGFGLGILMLVGAIGLLRRQRAGVARLRAWAVLRLVLVFIGILLTVAFAPANFEFQKAAVEMQNDLLRESDMADRIVEKSDAEIWRQMITGTAVASALFAAFPAFLGLYLSRRRILDEANEWE